MAGIEEHTFFVYDTTINKKEEDDPEDAIVYFYPESVSINHQCMLCGQLIGAISFIGTISASAPKLIKLKKVKFAIRYEGIYVIALAGSLQIQNKVLTSRLDALYRLFVLFHGSVTKVQEESLNRDFFLCTMKEIWTCYLRFVHRRCNTVMGLFDSIPTLNIPKNLGSLFLRSSHILQSCHRHQGVLAGCILYKNSIMCNEFPSQLVSSLLIQAHNRGHVPFLVADTDFPLPKGITILPVYLKPEEFQNSCSKVPDFKGQQLASSVRKNIKTALHDECLSNNFQPQLKSELNYSDTKEVYGTEKSISLSQDLLNLEHDNVTIQKAASINHQKNFANSATTKLASVDNSLTDQNLSINYKNHKKDAKCVPTMENNLENCTNSYIKTESDNQTCSPNNVKISTKMFDEEDQCLLSNSADQETSNCEGNYVASGDQDHNPMSSFVRDSQSSICGDNSVTSGDSMTSLGGDHKYLAADTDNKTNLLFDVDILSVPSTDKENSLLSTNDVSSVDRKNGFVQLYADDNQAALKPTYVKDQENFKKILALHELKKCSLYVQAHSEMVLLLIMDYNLRDNHQLINKLWKMILPLLGDLEAELNQLPDSPLTMDETKNYRFIQVNQNEQKLQGLNFEIKNPAAASLFNSSVQLMSNELTENPNMTDLTLRTTESVLYGHQSSKTQTLFQPTRVTWPIKGIPSPNDQDFCLEQRTKRKLHREHNINVV